MQEQLDRIEAKLDALLARRESHGSKRKSKAQTHDEAVAGAKLPFEYESFAQAWQSYCDMRKGMHAYLTELAVEKILKKLGSYGVVAAVEALDNSVMNSWKGVFPETVRQTIDKQELFKEDF